VLRGKGEAAYEEGVLNQSHWKNISITRRLSQLQKKEHHLRRPLNSSRHMKAPLVNKGTNFLNRIGGGSGSLTQKKGNKSINRAIRWKRKFYASQFSWEKHMLIKRF